MRRTAVVNQIRTLLLERGLTLPKGRRYVDEQLPLILEDAELRLSGSFRVLLAQLKIERADSWNLRESLAGFERISIMARSQ